MNILINLLWVRGNILDDWFCYSYPVRVFVSIYNYSFAVLVVFFLVHAVFKIRYPFSNYTVPCEFLILDDKHYLTRNRFV